MGNIKGISGDNIRTLRTGRGWTQVYLADRLQITAPFLAQIEAGKRGMSLEVIEATAEVFDVPVAALFLEQRPTFAKAELRGLGLEAAEKQLQENVSKAISQSFAKLRRGVQA